MVAKISPAINFKQLRFQNFVFRKNHLYLQPSNPSSKALYIINTKQLSCDSILFPAEVLKDTSGKNQADKNVDIIQIDKQEKFAYFCYNRTVFQLDLKSKKVRKVITETEQEKPFQQESVDFKRDLATILVVEDVRYRPRRWSWEVEQVGEYALGALPADTAQTTLRWLDALQDHI